MRKIWPIIFLAACTPLHDNLHTTEGEGIETAWVFMQPFCIFLCNTHLSTTGSKVDSAGSGSVSSTQSTSQSAQTGR